ncbi:MAG TPA: hypothetical protein VFL65_01090 [Jatrophihabitans sp.]|nr:hypothetical protein [Jatrophihabitans sp.]
MNRRSKQGLALLGGAALLTLAWPGASSAQTSLGGYSGVAQAAGIRVQIYEPVIPIPSSPQIDGSIGYAKANTDTGPVSRATASYLWPGDVVGDGFDQLAGNPNAKYPVQVNSRYPATADSPAQNTAQLTDGNGMTTSSNESATTASVTGLGVAGSGVNLLGGLGKGLGQLAGHSSSPSAPDVPVPVSSTLAALATLENLHITSSVVVGKDTVTSSARATMSSIKLLAGLISINGMDVRSESVSNGTKATESGSLSAMQLSVAGQSFTLGDKGVQFGGTATKLPPVPAALTTLLGKIGISFGYAPTAQSVQGATGAQSTSGLVISIDTVPLKTALNLGGLVAPLQQLIEKIPTLGSQLAPLLGLGPKIVLTLGDVSSTATAAPAYTGGSFPVTGGGTTGTTGSGGVVPAGSTGGGIGGGGGLPGGSTGGTPGTGPVAPAAPASTPTQATGFELPGLGAVPRGLILGGLALAALVGWGLRLVGGLLLGGGRTCAFGLPTGVPDLRKG